MTGLRVLEEELARWAMAGEAATFWWRDDDAVAATDQLDRLLAVAEGVPVMLAVIPKPLTASLAPRLAGSACVVVQHGWAHVNHRPPGQKACEIGEDRPSPVVEAELVEGRRILSDAFGGRFRPWLVPPWNRIDPAVIDRLPALGYQGLSTFGPRKPAEKLAERSADKLAEVVNALVDPIAWKDGRRFIGPEKTLARLAAHLAARRTRVVDLDEPTGLLTHHLVHDEDLWSFLAALAAALARHPAACWVDPTQGPRQASAEGPSPAAEAGIRL